MHCFPLNKAGYEKHVFPFAWVRGRGRGLVGWPAIAAQLTSPIIFEVLLKQRDASGGQPILLGGEVRPCKLHPLEI